MAARQWLSFPDPQGRYRLEGAALRKAWPRLHRGDREPWPTGKLAPARQAAPQALPAVPQKAAQVVSPRAGGTATTQ